MLRALARPFRNGFHGNRLGKKRQMSGLVEKNYFVEEWNGRREITEKTFKFNSKTVPSLIGLVIVFPGFIYYVMKDELKKKYEKLGYNTEEGGNREMM
ncbi:hypothetical protein NSK_001131 [Nannochloropsis salina CCMP1776]|uniref:Uncharacterized protein n=1 Tax=Nannochloropsis salina CCMP1776 TaxID=1027361 RepID=A0A4D9D9U5_9STRA|nr:hypothetical protein NSK_001131 [Nannochloropsis salina CCMP1776]|eukprot:TFJ87784.1 hypothetical protein NSK_001131 [Nannochloropsis salina CCMP1776]